MLNQYTKVIVLDSIIRQLTRCRYANLLARTITFLYLNSYSPLGRPATYRHHTKLRLQRMQSIIIDVRPRRVLYYDHIKNVGWSYHDAGRYRSTPRPSTTSIDDDAPCQCPFEGYKRSLTMLPAYRYRLWVPTKHPYGRHSHRCTPVAPIPSTAPHHGYCLLQ